MTSDFVETTAPDMQPDWVVYDRGAPGTIAYALGGSIVCRRCFDTHAAIDHICADIARGARRWVRTDLVP